MLAADITGGRGAVLATGAAAGSGGGGGGIQPNGGPKSGGGGGSEGLGPPTPGRVLRRGKASGVSEVGDGGTLTGRGV